MLFATEYDLFFCLSSLFPPSGYFHYFAFQEKRQMKNKFENKYKNVSHTSQFHLGKRITK